MLASLEFPSSLSSQLLRLAQIRIEPGAFIVDNPSSPEIFVALLSGIAMAFAFGLLLTNLGVAILSSPGTPDLDSDSDDGDGDDEGLMSTMRGIETKVGFAALITVTFALFAACYLAVKLSLVNNAFDGAILGVVVWSVYFTLVVWLGSRAVGSLIGSIVSTATSGLQGIMGTATTALGANVAKNQVVSTAEEVTAAVRRELTSGFDPSSIQKTLQSSLGNLQLPGVDVDKIGSQFEKRSSNCLPSKVISLKNRSTKQ